MLEGTWRQTGPCLSKFQIREYFVVWILTVSTSEVITEYMKRFTYALLSESRMVILVEELLGKHSVVDKRLVFSFVFQFILNIFIEKVAVATDKMMECILISEQAVVMWTVWVVLTSEKLPVVKEQEFKVTQMCDDYLFPRTLHQNTIHSSQISLYNLSGDILLN